MANYPCGCEFNAQNDWVFRAKDCVNVGYCQERAKADPGARPVAFMGDVLEIGLGPGGQEFEFAIPETPSVIRFSTKEPNLANTPKELPAVRTFDSGATRDVDDNKLDYEGFLSVAVLDRYAEYMHKNRFQKDGSIRDSDNWQKGIPRRVYMKSGVRHFFEWWRIHRGLSGDAVEEALCALIFNASGYLHEVLKAKREVKSGR